MSGHNKWSKIKRKKAITDGQKSKIFSKYSALIALESRKVAGNLNSPGLTAVIDRAKKDGMPKDNIERAVAKGAGVGGNNFEEVMFEGFAFGGVALLITAITDNNNRTSQEIKHIFTKAGLQLGAPGSASWAFTKTEEGYEAISPLEVSDEDFQKNEELISNIEDNDDVQEVYSTIVYNDEEKETN